VLLGSTFTEPDPSSYVNLLRSSSPGHQWHPSQSSPATDWERRLDELAALQARERNIERRRALFAEAQTLVARELPLIPIISRHVLIAADQRIGNLRPATTLPFSLWNADELFIRPQS
jgi:peptide/nickel transport system substrate-binding protein